MFASTYRDCWRSNITTLLVYLNLFLSTWNLLYVRFYLFTQCVQMVVLWKTCYATGLIYFLQPKHKRHLKNIICSVQCLCLFLLEYQFQNLAKVTLFVPQVWVTFREFQKQYINYSTFLIQIWNEYFWCEHQTCS